MSKEELDGELVETEVFPICDECKYLAVDCKGIIKKTYLFACSAQGYQGTGKVYGSENCKGAYVNQLNLPILKTPEGV